jgi:D-alanyl-lipoteichoic acid acyltransferase DltB (MBOAT superfamily)
MLFHSWVFAAFLAAVLALYAVLPHRAQNRMLLVASYVFYGYWDWRFLGLLLASTVVDFTVALALERSASARARRALLVTSCVVNLGLLGVFKYFGFFVESAAELAGALGVDWAPPVLAVVLPVGISFYTFQTLSYTVDVYRGQQRAARDLGDFALFVSFFPQLVAGPIERAGALLPQIAAPRRVTAEDVRAGAWLVLQGSFLKLVVADNLAFFVDQAFGPYQEVDGTIALLGVYAFAFQIYGDFAGYSSIARGIARLLGFRLSVNFAVPYLARNPSEFWRRWHITLSTWLRDYLYIPLGGSRHGRVRTAVALLVTMTLGGLWHGAAWTFVLWGVFHGLVLVVHRAVRGRAPAAGAARPSRARSRLHSALACFVTFHLVCFGWLLFRAGSLAQVGSFLAALAGPWSMSRFAIQMTAALVLFGGATWILDLWSGGRDDPLELPGWRLGLAQAACALMLVAWLVLTPSETGNFIYFQF